MHKDAPFKARINGDRCVLVLGGDAIRIEFEKFQRPFIMEYVSVRCVQCFGNTMLINASRDAGLSTYCITSASTRKIHRAVLDRLGEPSAAGTPDGADGDRADAVTARRSRAAPNRAVRTGAS